MNWGHVPELPHSTSVYGKTIKVRNCALWGSQRCSGYGGFKEERLLQERWESCRNYWDSKKLSKASTWGLRREESHCWLGWSGISAGFWRWIWVSRTSLVTQMVKHLPTMQETQVQSLGWEDPLEKERATHSSTLAWKIPRTEERGRLQSTGVSKSQTRLSDFTHLGFNRHVERKARTRN